MDKTLRELLERMEPEQIERVGGACVWETKSQYGDAWSQMLGWLAPILDAPVYGLCETCGGSREVAVPAAETDEFYTAFEKKTGEVVMKQAPCPDCTGTVSVVTKELRERAVEAVDRVFPCIACYEDYVAVIDAVLSTVFGKIRRAVAVGRVVNDPHGVLVDCEDGLQRSVGDRIPIALLEDDEEEEEPKK